MSVQTIDSTVASLDTKTLSKLNRYGKPIVIHYVVTADGDRVSIGFKQTYKVGDKFSADVETSYGELKFVGPASGPATPKNTTAGPKNASNKSEGGGGRVFPVPELSGEMSIIRQNALTNARELVVATIADLPDGATKAEREQFYDAVVEDILRVAYKFADFSSGHREVKLAKKLNTLSENE